MAWMTAFCISARQPADPFRAEPHPVGRFCRSALSGDAGASACRPAAAMTIPAPPIISARSCAPITRLPDWGTQLQLSWGKAYKLPSFYALGNPIVGDPTLKPEDAEIWKAASRSACGISAQLEGRSLCHQLSRPDRFPPRRGAQAGQSFHRACARLRDLARSTGAWDTLTRHAAPVLYQCPQHRRPARSLRDVPQLAGRRDAAVAAGCALGRQLRPQPCRRHDRQCRAHRRRHPAPAMSAPIWRQLYS